MVPAIVRIRRLFMALISGCGLIFSSTNHPNSWYSSLIAGVSVLILITLAWRVRPIIVMHMHSGGAHAKGPVIPGSIYKEEGNTENG